MKVMFIIPSMAGGGAERVIAVLANAFVEKGIGTKIMMTAGSDCVYELHPRIELIQTGVTTGGSMLKRISRICNMRKIFKKSRDSVIVAFEPDAAFFAGIAKIGLSMKMVASERNDPRSFGNSRVRKLAYEMADKLVFQTKDAMEYFAPNIQKKGTIIPNPVNDSLPEVYVGERKDTVVAVGRLEQQKNHRMLIEAFAEFVEAYPTYSLHLYGKGDMEEELKILAHQLKVEQKVIFEGFQKDVLLKIRDAGMYVLSSDYEGISNSLLEAMAIGLPVISTDCPCGGSRLCIKNEVNGLLIPVGDVKALADAMKKMAESSQKANEFGAEAAKIRERFSTNHIADQWIQELGEFVS